MLLSLVILFCFKAGVFVGAQIIDFTRFLKASNQSWKGNMEQPQSCIVHKFLGIHDADNHVLIITNLITNFVATGCKMSVKLHMHVGVTFGQIQTQDPTLKNTEKSFIMILWILIADFKAIWYNEYIMSIYLWNLIRESNEYRICNTAGAFCCL